jgi:hypothetical protein
VGQIPIKLSLFIINANSVAIVFTMVWVRVMVFSANEIGVTNKKKIVGEEVMVVNATFNNISAISQRSVLLVEETGVTVENH